MELRIAFERLLVAALIGFLVGLDRERAEGRQEQGLFAGVRTFPLIALAGAVPSLLPPPGGTALLVASFLAVAAIALVSYVRSSAAGHIGATTEVAALVTFLLGALAASGQLGAGRGGGRRRGGAAGRQAEAGSVLARAPPPPSWRRRSSWRWCR